MSALTLVQGSRKLTVARSGETRIYIRVQVGAVIADLEIDSTKEILAIIYKLTEALPDDGV